MDRIHLYILYIYIYIHIYIYIYIMYIHIHWRWPRPRNHCIFTRLIFKWFLMGSKCRYGNLSPMIPTTKSSKFWVNLAPHQISRCGCFKLYLWVAKTNGKAWKGPAGCARESGWVEEDDQLYQPGIHWDEAHFSPLIFSGVKKKITPGKPTQECILKAMENLRSYNNSPFLYNHLFLKWWVPGDQT